MGVSLHPRLGGPSLKWNAGLHLTISSPGEKSGFITVNGVPQFEIFAFEGQIGLPFCGFRWLVPASDVFMSQSQLIPLQHDLRKNWCLVVSCICRQQKLCPGKDFPIYLSLLHLNNPLSEAEKELFVELSAQEKLLQSAACSNFLELFTEFLLKASHHEPIFHDSAPFTAYNCHSSLFIIIVCFCLPAKIYYLMPEEYIFLVSHFKHLDVFIP